MIKANCHTPCVKNSRTGWVGGVGLPDDLKISKSDYTG